MADAAKTSDVIVKAEPNYEVGSMVKIKSEVVSDEHDCDDQPKRVQLPSSYGQALWTDVRCRDDARPHRAIASVAPTPLNKLEGSETVQVAGHGSSPPHFLLVSPPPLAPLSGAPPLKMAALPDARRGNSVTSALRLSPALNASSVSCKAQTGFVSCPPIAVDCKWENGGRKPQSPVVLRRRERSRSRSRSPALDSDFEPDVRRTPSPEPQRINEVIRRSDRST